MYPSEIVLGVFDGKIHMQFFINFEKMFILVSAGIAIAGFV